jgi:hypothetical protein
VARADLDGHRRGGPPCWCLLFSASLDCTICVWTLGSWDRVQTVDVEQGSWYPSCLCVCGDKLVSGSRRKPLGGGQCYRTLEGRELLVWRLEAVVRAEEDGQGGLVIGGAAGAAADGRIVLYPHKPFEDRHHAQYSKCEVRILGDCGGRRGRLVL